MQSPILLSSAALTAYVVTSAPVASTFLQNLSLSRVFTGAVSGYIDVQPHTLQSHAINGGVLSRRGVACRMDSRRLPSIREMDITQSNITREGQPVVAINPRNPNNLLYTTTHVYPLLELEPVGGCFLAYSFVCGRTQTNVTAEYPLATAPKCGEP